MRSFYPAAKVKRLVAVAAVASVVTSFVVLTGNPSFVRFRMSDVAASDPAKVAESFEARRGRLEAVCDTYKVKKFKF
jgi:hypothetical protein